MQKLYRSPFDDAEQIKEGLTVIRIQRDLIQLGRCNRVIQPNLSAAATAPLRSQAAAQQLDHNPAFIAILPAPAFCPVVTPQARGLKRIRPFPLSPRVDARPRDDHGCLNGVAL